MVYSYPTLNTHRYDVSNDVIISLCTVPLYSNIYFQNGQPTLPVVMESYKHVYPSIHVQHNFHGDGKAHGQHQGHEKWTRIWC